MVSITRNRESLPHFNVGPNVQSRSADIAAASGCHSTNELKVSGSDRKRSLLSGLQFR